MSTFTALHRALGRPPGPLTGDMVDEAIAVNLAERDDLDFKRELPPESALAHSDFPKDIAAQANSGGGTLVYGVIEENKRAVGPHAVTLSENHERSLHAVARSAIFPPVMHLVMEQLGEPGAQCVVVVVPASLEVPHLIYRGDYFAAPVRNDADTAWMTERALEAAYRSRFTEHRDRAAELADLYARAGAISEDGVCAWLVAAAVPRAVAGPSTRMSRDDAAALFTAARRPAFDLAGPDAGVHPLDGGLNPDDLRRGLRSWRAVPRGGPDGMWRLAFASVGDLGAVTLTAAVGGHRRGADGRCWAGHQVEITAIECALADVLGLVRAAADRLGAHDYDLQVGIERGPEGPGLRFLRPDPRTPGQVLDPDHAPWAEFQPVLVTIPADVDEEQFRGHAHDLALDCLNQGEVTETSVIHLGPAGDGHA